MRTVLSVLMSVMAAASVIGAAATPRAGCRHTDSGGRHRDSRRWRAERRHLANGAAHYRIPPARSEGRRSADIRDGGAGRVRRDGAVHRGSGVRPRAQTHRRHPHPARRRIAVGLDPRDRRLVSRPAIGLRVRGEPGRRQAGYATGSTTTTTIRAGMRCGTSASRARSAAGAPSSAFPFSQLRFRPSDDFDVRPGDRPRRSAG